MDSTRLNEPILETVYCGDQYGDGEWLPENLGDAIAWLQEILDRVPSEYRKKARIEVETDYNENFVNISILYARPPTAEDKQKRLNAEQARLAKIEAVERRAYEVMKAKYDPS
ncbi:MAG: hypothetical protein IH919_07400 [Deltaproteobacteria bacterium]|nr:hypothetical protein [Deltaproteobacteria bacterium]